MRSSAVMSGVHLLAALAIVSEPVIATVLNWQQWAYFDDYNASTQCDAADPNRCFGNGECMAGSCYCDIGWRGIYCSQLDLLPARRAAPGLPRDSRMPTWGGSGVFEDGRWQFLTGAKLYNLSLSPPFYDEWAARGLSPAPPIDVWGRQPPFNQSSRVPVPAPGDPYGGVYPWQFKTSVDPYDAVAQPDLYGQSFVVRMVSTDTDPAGPYEMAEVVHKAFRADFKRAYATGNDTNASGRPLYFLTIGTIVGAPTQGRGMLIKLSQSGSVHGPWLERVVYDFDANGHGQAHDANQWDCDVKDPSFVVHSDGRTVIAYRATCCDCGDHTERIGLLHAPAWNASYTRVGTPLFDQAEDLFMWQSERGTHMIFHSQKTDHGTRRNIGSDHKKKRGGYAFSADGVNGWIESDWELFPSEIRWDDGTTSFLLKQQRPSLLFDPMTNRPSHLVTGVDEVFDPCCEWYIYGSAWTLIQPLVTACPAGSLPSAVESTEAAPCVQCNAADLGCGRCLQATTKYGECVCAVCASGYAGDHCEQRAMECLTDSSDGSTLSAAVDFGFAPKRECVDPTTGLAVAASERVTLIPSSDEPGLPECAAACARHAQQWSQEGCCYSLQSLSKTCYFTPGGIMKSNNGAKRHATQCLRPAMTAACPPSAPPLVPPSAPPPALPSPSEPPEGQAPPLAPPPSAPLPASNSSLPSASPHLPPPAVPPAPMPPHAPPMPSPPDSPPAKAAVQPPTEPPASPPPSCPPAVPPPLIPASEPGSGSAVAPPSAPGGESGSGEGGSGGTGGTGKGGSGGTGEGASGGTGEGGSGGSGEGGSGEGGSSEGGSGGSGEGGSGEGGSGGSGGGGSGGGGEGEGGSGEGLPPASPPTPAPPLKPPAGSSPTPPRSPSPALPSTPVVPPAQLPASPPSPALPPDSPSSLPPVHPPPHPLQTPMAPSPSSPPSIPTAPASPPPQTPIPLPSSPPPHLPQPPLTPPPAPPQPTVPPPSRPPPSPPVPSLPPKLPPSPPPPPSVPPPPLSPPLHCPPTSAPTSHLPTVPRTPPPLFPSVPQSPPTQPLASAPDSIDGLISGASHWLKEASVPVKTAVIAAGAIACCLICFCLRRRCFMRLGGGGRPAGGLLPSLPGRSSTSRHRVDPFKLSGGSGGMVEIELNDMASQPLPPAPWLRAPSSRRFQQLDDAESMVAPLRAQAVPMMQAQIIHELPVERVGASTLETSRELHERL